MLQRDLRTPRPWGAKYPREADEPISEPIIGGLHLRTHMNLDQRQDNLYGWRAPSTR